MEVAESAEIVKFSVLSSSMEPSFWYKLAQVKLEVDKLEEKERHLWGSCCIADNAAFTSRLSVDCSSFNREYHPSKPTIGYYGTLINKNTMESFKKVNKMSLLTEHGMRMLADIESGDAMCNPALLCRFLLLTFADLKKYHFYYGFAFPAVIVPGVNVNAVAPISRLKAVFSTQQRRNLASVYLNLCDWTQRTAFVVTVAGDDVSWSPLQHIHTVPMEVTDSTDGSYLVVADPAPSGADNPGWPLRNILVMLASRCSYLVGRRLRVICLRLVLMHSDQWWPDHSLLLQVCLSATSLSDPSVLRWVGWERNSAGRYGPRAVNLSSSMDPKQLAEASVDLNLKLMKWRLVPELSLDVIRNTRCLLLGAGTLGCAVARGLLAWGVRHITLVDNGKVSYSNPVRQSLYIYTDCEGGGKAKAVAAANALHSIFPGVTATGVELSIPMPGHPVSPALLADTRQSVEQLKKLVDRHDVLFLLTDSRESRWLPTLLGMSKQKLTICSALGFDTFLVMRHGVPMTSNLSAVGDGNADVREIGCYYCSDVTAPGNSLVDRTLDQQCTVTRPGLSSIAAGFAVELLVNILQHPQGAAAPPCNNPSTTGGCRSNDGLMGCVPHTIRGYLSQFELVMPMVPKFHNCTACSPSVVNEFNCHGWDFLLQVFNSPDYLKEVSGLAQLCKETEDVEEDICNWSDSELEDTE